MEVMQLLPSLSILCMATLSLVSQSISKHGKCTQPDSFCTVATASWGISEDTEVFCSYCESCRGISSYGVPSKDSV